jgi:hypothetical protein
VAGPFYFAWCGGAVEPQTTLVTNGTTHGGDFESSTLVGTLTSGDQQLTQVASTSDLTSQALYHLHGGGYDGYFLYEPNVLTGLEGSINLNTAASSTIASGQFTATKAITIGTVLGTVTAGSSAIVLDAPGLAAGTYGITGSGIGETDIPYGTMDGTTDTTGGGQIIIGAAFLDYAGGGSGTLYVFAATPHTTIVEGSLGELEGVTTYTVAAQAVRATASGQLPFVISGFPATNPTLIDGLPSSALMGLTPGLVYNITGNGLQVGTTFVAPSSGTSITIDLEAQTSEINAILTITGPRTSNAPFDPAAHARFDEDIVSVEIAQEEGGLATLRVSLKNPNVGLLATGRNLWAWLSWDSAWPSGTPDIQPLFNGRLIGVPRLQAGELVDLEFLARPDDMNAQKTALADSLKVLPYYDPVWYASSTATSSATNDTVLEAYSALWHIDRTTLALSTSDVLVGEDGIIDIGEDASLYDAFSLSYGQPPVIATSVTGTVTWQQQAAGRVDVTSEIVAAFHNAGSYWQYGFANKPYSEGGGALIQVMGDGLASDWPRAGTSIGSGWSLSTGTDAGGMPLNYIYLATWYTPVNYVVTFEGHTYPTFHLGATLDETNLAVYLSPVSSFTVDFPLNVYKIKMTLDYKADRKRTETVTAVMLAGLQATLSDPAEQDREALSYSSEYVGQAVDLDHSVPIGNVAYRSYFQTARGAQSFEYLLLAARAKMRARARAVDIAFAVPWAQALGITLRNSVRLTDRRLPGGIATGKVKSYKLTCSSDGVMRGDFTIGCPIGTGDGTAPQAGVPVYVDPGYVVDGYEMVEGQQIVAGNDADFAYETLDDFAISDDNLDLTYLTAAKAVIDCRVLNGLLVQLTALSATQGTTTDPRTATADEKTTVTLDLQPLQGSEFHTDFYPAVTELLLPKGIDLSAPTGP